MADQQVSHDALHMPSVWTRRQSILFLHYSLCLLHYYVMHRFVSYRVCMFCTWETIFHVIDIIVYGWVDNKASLSNMTSSVDLKSQSEKTDDKILEENKLQLLQLSVPISPSMNLRWRC